MQENLAIATFATGCFWCTEAVFQQLKGVIKVESGYTGGKVPNPTYKQVCNQNTGHAEVLRITYDPAIISYDELLEVFWASHDPTSMDRQGNDIGPQYRSIIFYHNKEQEKKAIASKELLNRNNVFGKPVVTFIQPAADFYTAEKVHHDYYNNNPTQPYCYYVVKPKVEKIKKLFSEKLK